MLEDIDSLPFDLHPDLMTVYPQLATARPDGSVAREANGFMFGVRRNSGSYRWLRDQRLTFNDQGKPVKIATGLPALAVALVALLLTACAARTAPPAMTALQTAEYRAAQSLATVAEINRGVTVATIALNREGKLSNAITKDLLTYFDQVASVDQLAVDLLKSPEPWLSKAPRILAFLDLLRKPASIQNFNQPQANPSHDIVALQVGAMDTYITAARTALKP